MFRGCAGLHDEGRPVRTFLAEDVANEGPSRPELDGKGFVFVAHLRSINSGFVRVQQRFSFRAAT